MTRHTNPNLFPLRGGTQAAAHNGHAFPGPDDITRVELPNGIVVLTRANFNSPAVVLKGYLPAGSLNDPDSKLGLAYFSALALMRGTSKRSFQEIYWLLESSGASLSVNGGTHSASFSSQALCEDLDLVLGMLAETLREPTFPQTHVERLRTQILTSLAIRAQDTGDMASLVFDQIVYPGHPYSRPEDGYPETVKTIEQADLVDFHRKYYGPRGMVIVIVGAVEPAEAIDKVQKAFGDWQNPEQPQETVLPSLNPLDKTTRQDVTIPGKAQVDIMLGAAGPPRISPDFIPAALGNNILGQFGMMGRIGDAVREKAGLAYYASSSLSGGSGPGAWYISAGVAPQNVERALELIIEEVRRFTSQPVFDEELLDSQASFIGSLPISLESNQGVASALINLERHKLGLDYYRRYAERISAVTKEQVLEAASRYLDPERLGIAVAGSDIKAK